MTKQETEKRITALIINNANVDTDDIAGKGSISDLDYASMSIGQLMVDLEQEFQIEMQDMESSISPHHI